MRSAHLILLTFVVVDLSFAQACKKSVAPPQHAEKGPSLVIREIGTDWEKLADDILRGFKPLPALMAQGKTLATAHCDTCHAQPPPEALPKHAWVEVFKRLHDTLQIGEPATAPPTTAVAARGLAAPAAKLTGYRIAPLDFSHIVAYYLSEAPTEIKTPNASVRSTSPTPFTVAFTAPAEGPVLHTLAVFEPRSRRVILGDGLLPGLSVLEPLSGRIERSLKLSGAPTGLVIRDARAYITLMGLSIGQGEGADGKIISLPLTAVTGSGRMRETVILAGLRRPVHTTWVDLDGDAREEMVVEEFGLREGSLSLFTKTTAGGYAKQLLADRSGTVGTVIRDFTDDGRPDIAALLGQADEGLSLYENQGRLNFAEQRISRDHAAYGYTALSAADVDGDERIDLLTVNGDNLDLNSRPTKNYHGIRIWRNHGGTDFRLWKFLPMDGAVHAIARDFDGDGDVDIAAVAYSPDFKQTPLETFVYFEQIDGEFVAHVIPELQLGRWGVAVAGDFDGDGDDDLVLAGASFPSSQLEWDNKFSGATPLRVAVLLNTSVARR